MFDLNLVVKGIALVVAIGLLLTSIDFSYLLAKLSVKEDVKPVVDNKVVVKVDPDSTCCRRLCDKKATEKGCRYAPPRSCAVGGDRNADILRCGGSSADRATS